MLEQFNDLVSYEEFGTREDIDPEDWSLTNKVDLAHAVVQSRLILSNMLEEDDGWLEHATTSSL